LLDNARQVLDNLAADMLADRPDDWQERKADLEDEKQEAAQAEMDAIRNEIANEATWYIIRVCIPAQITNNCQVKLIPHKSLLMRLTSKFDCIRLDLLKTIPTILTSLTNLLLLPGSFKSEVKTKTLHVVFIYAVNPT
jgi:hypothetical protein